MAVEFEHIQRFCQSRPVELALAPSTRSGQIILHADFENNADFFLSKRTTLSTSPWQQDFGLGVFS